MGKCDEIGSFRQQLYYVMRNLYQLIRQLGAPDLVNIVHLIQYTHQNKQQMFKNDISMGEKKET